MKPASIISLILCFFGINSASIAQQPLFAPLGAVWHYNRYNCPGLPSPQPEALTITEDTIINGKYCTIIFNGGCSNASCNDLAYVHQDGSKVFVYEPLFNDFQMLYDFSLQTGDSYTYIMCEEKWGVDTVTIHVDFADPDPTGAMHLRVVPNHPTWWDETSAEIVKGVGGLYIFNRLLFNEVMCEQITIDCPTYSQLICYETPDSVNYPAGCFVSAVGEGSLDNEPVMIYPQPASDYLNIEIASQMPTHQGLFRILDMKGRMVKDWPVLSPSEITHLPVRDLAAGVYSLQYFSKNELRTVKKFVVAR
ncbi:MAG: T9SS type A sorting domain-containing protein [Saprospiraceae bacterium]|nr:T9SS type A sorting domain-containing protein [Saprospiraceae bacterium]